MAQWQRRLSIKDVWDSKDVHLIATKIAERLKGMLPLSIESIDEERVDIADEFESLAEDHDADTDDFDYVMQRLYDWADTPLDNQFNGKKVCWVETF